MSLEYLSSWPTHLIAFITEGAHSRKIFDHIGADSKPAQRLGRWAAMVGGMAVEMRERVTAPESSQTGIWPVRRQQAHRATALRSFLR